MQYAIWLGLFLPLVSFLFLTATAKVIGRQLTSWIGCGAIFIPFVCFTSMLYLYTAHDMSALTLTLYKWIDFGGIHADFTLQLDHLSLLMTLIITGVGFLIHVYSVGYMDHDEEYARFFSYLNFFVFAMLLLVLASNLLLLFVGWEGVGLASYLLIGFWYQRPTAAAAATKAFVVNRVGDLGLLLGLLLTFHLFGTSDISEISKRVGQEFTLGAPILTLLTLLYFIGATGKSAQLPLHTWLPDAMEGPTPVSALIHAATMVTAGVYLVVRMHPVFLLAPITLQVVGVVGAATALFASLCAIGQTDLKRVLAYSTVSQLGLMFLACGAGAFYSAMFHLTTHAFIKALLFLSAGNVVHMMAGETQMAKMGGLSKIFPKTRWLFLIGVLALSGIPPLAAFFSKDLILEQEHLAGFDTLYYVGLAASILTGFYLTRAYCLAFTGTPRLEESALKHVHEAPNIMIIPVSVLALLAMIGGGLGLAFGKAPPLLEGFLSEVGLTIAEKELVFGSLFNMETLIAVCGSFLGVGVSVFIYARMKNPPDHPLAVLRRSFYIDELYDFFIVLPLKGFAWILAYFVEPKVFDGAINVSTAATQAVARNLQVMQSGQIRSYMAWMAIGMAVLVVYFVI